MRIARAITIQYTINDYQNRNVKYNSQDIQQDCFQKTASTANKKNVSFGQKIVADNKTILKNIKELKDMLMTQYALLAKSMSPDIQKSAKAAMKEASGILKSDLATIKAGLKCEVEELYPVNLRFKTGVGTRYYTKSVDGDYITITTYPNDDFNFETALHRYTIRKINDKGKYSISLSKEWGGKDNVEEAKYILQGDRFKIVDCSYRNGNGNIDRITLNDDKLKYKVVYLPENEDQLQIPEFSTSIELKKNY